MPSCTIWVFSVLLLFLLGLGVLSLELLFLLEELHLYLVLRATFFAVTHRDECLNAALDHGHFHLVFGLGLHVQFESVGPRLLLDHPQKELKVAIVELTVN